jgi:SAM-dependent methyltransferase
MDHDFLRRIREYELERILALVPSRSSILEIGAGAGWQARALSESGHRVEAIDIAESSYVPDRVWPVRDYDGANIPFPDEQFDVVFSSNVLEHIPHVDSFQKEIQRVLKPGGIAVHCLPTPTWRLWTTLAHYVAVPLRVLGRLTGGDAGPAVPSDRRAATPATHRPIDLVRMALAADRHGERGNVITETWWFSRHRWLSLFRASGWAVRAHYPTWLFYTGYLLSGPMLDVPARHRLSRILGSSCRIYVLEKKRAVKDPSGTRSPGSGGATASL